LLKHSIIALVGLLGCAFDSAGIATADSTTGPGSTSIADASTTTTPTSVTTASDTTTTAPTADASTSTTDSGTSTADSSTTDPSAGSSESTGDPAPIQLGPFAEPTPVDILNSDAFDDDPTLRADLREIYFASTRPEGQGSEEIWRSERASIDDDWDPPTLMTAFNSPDQDGWPELSRDGLVLTFGSNRAGGAGGFDLYIVTRADTDAAWSEPMPLAELNTPGGEASAVFSDDRTEVLFTSGVASNADDISRATRRSTAVMFDAPAPLLTVNTDARDAVAFLDVTQTRVLFASNRPGTGGMDLWTAVRDRGTAFDEAVEIDGVNTIADEDDPWWADDGSVLYFARTGPAGTLDIFVAEAE
jgi:hypothetical protein